MALLLALIFLTAVLVVLAIRMNPRRLPFRSRRRGNRQTQGSLLPPRSSALFPPSHHETLHDPGYLRRILEGEADRKGRNGADADDDATPAERP